MKHSAFCTLPLNNHICAVMLVLNVLSLLLVIQEVVAPVDRGVQEVIASTMRKAVCQCLEPIRVYLVARQMKPSCSNEGNV